MRVSRVEEFKIMAELYCGAYLRPVPAKVALGVLLCVR
jgi:hypothetical protein